jgi:hypothetical protein
MVHSFYSHFLDDRDLGGLVVTHIYLLLGCAMPLWAAALAPSGANPAMPFAGLLVLGVGDAAVSEERLPRGPHGSTGVTITMRSEQMSWTNHYRHQHQHQHQHHAHPPSPPIP